MKRVSLCLALALISFGFVGTALAVDGAAIYKSKCAMCHGAEGQGSVMGNAFTGNLSIASASEAAITAIIINGRNGAAKKYKKFSMGMPAQKLTGAEVSAVVAHLKSLAAK